MGVFYPGFSRIFPVEDCGGFWRTQELPGRAPVGGDREADEKRAQKKGPIRRSTPMREESGGGVAPTT
jgi:hypothetical protein